MRPLAWVKDRWLGWRARRAIPGKTIEERSAFMREFLDRLEEEK